MSDEGSERTEGTGDRFSRDVAKALERRRPSPSRDFEVRLLAAATRPRPVRWMVPAALAAAVAVVAIVVLALGRHDGEAEPDRREPSQVAGPIAPSVIAGDPGLVEVLGGNDAGLGLDDGQRARLRKVTEMLAAERNIATSQRELAKIELDMHLGGSDVTQARAALARLDEADRRFVQALADARAHARSMLTEAQRAKLPAVVATVPPKPPQRPQLPQRHATLTIKSDPPGAMVLLDDVRLGATPLHVEVAPGSNNKSGTRVLRLELPGYSPVEHVLDPDALQPGTALELELAMTKTSVQVQLRSRRTTATGTLRLQATPVASVFVDGRRAGDTPLVLELAPGRHRIDLDNADLSRRVTKLVTIEVGKTVSMNVDLAAGP